MLSDFKDTTEQSVLWLFMKTIQTWFLLIKLHNSKKLVFIDATNGNGYLGAGILKWLMVALIMNSGSRSP